jgi:ribonucleoside-diphosphate reductase alpha subunit
MLKHMDNNNCNMEVYYVTKRTNEKEEVSFDKILKRIKNMSSALNINSTMLTQKLVSQIYNEIPTCKIDELAAELCASMAPDHPDYLILASRLEISNLHKNTSPSFSETIVILYGNKDHSQIHSPLISTELYNIVLKNKTKLNSYIKYDRDSLIDYFGLKTLERSYLIKILGRIIERPQHLFMRTALGIHGDDIKEALKTYDMLSQKYFIHATPTLFNSGTNRPQLSSCFLLAMKDDSIDGIFSSIKDCAMISKWAGGIGIHIHNIRATNSIIRGTNGVSNGIVPMLRVFNNTARYVDQGGGKRNGSIAIYIEPWHADINSFLSLKKNTGSEEERARDLFYALWIPDLFMERVRDKGTWTLMCPDKCPGLSDVYGAEFNTLYEQYEREGRGIKTINAGDLWFSIIESQIETGTPYMLYKDACNSKSNQQNLGTIKSSNLCTEIIEYSSPTEFAVCNLASIGLPKYIIDNPNIEKYTKVKIYSVPDCRYCIMAKRLLNECHIDYVEEILDTKDTKKQLLDSINANNVECKDGVCILKDGQNNVRTFPQIYIDDNHIGGYQELYTFLPPAKIFDFDKLIKVVKIITRNLDKIIDVNYYPIPETERSNKLHRPIGIGIQGLADVFAMLKMPFDSIEARALNEKIAETIYYSAVETSIELSKKREVKMNKLKELMVEHKNGSLSDTSEMDLLRESLCNPLDEELNRDKYLGSYSSFIGSPANKGKLQYDLWGEEPSVEMKPRWNKVKKDLHKYGMRNSLLIAPMPTASTSQILGNNECFEPFTSNIYIRRTLAGEFIMINKHLIRDLLALGLWNTELKNTIIKENGSVQNIPYIPDNIKEIYKTVWEVGNKTLIDMSADRGKYICQSQSLNLFMADPEYSRITSMHFYSWKRGLKTGQYYLRTKPAAKAQQFTIEPDKSPVPNMMVPEDCEACGA